jgi:hypothetical protein
MVCKTIKDNFDQPTKYKIQRGRDRYLILCSSYSTIFIVSIPLCYGYDIHKYYTIFNLTQLNFFIIDIY